MRSQLGAGEVCKKTTTSATGFHRSPRRGIKFEDLHADRLQRMATVNPGAGDHGRMDGWEIRAYADDGTGTGIAGDGILQQDEYNAGFCRQRLH